MSLMDLFGLIVLAFLAYLVFIIWKKNKGIAIAFVLLILVYHTLAMPLIFSLIIAFLCFYHSSLDKVEKAFTIIMLIPFFGNFSEFIGLNNILEDTSGNAKFNSINLATSFLIFVIAIIIIIATDEKLRNSIINTDNKPPVENTFKGRFLKRLKKEIKDIFK